MPNRNWDGFLPIRRYAIFQNNITQKNYAIVVTEEDINRAEKWGGFVSWLGAVKSETYRNFSSSKYAAWKNSY